MSAGDPQDPAEGAQEPEAAPEVELEPEPGAKHPTSDETRGARAPHPPQQGQGRLPSGLFQRLRLARQALTVVRGYSFFGTILAAGIFASSYVMYEAALPRWICRLGAMGTLLGAVVGLNVMDRLVRGRYLPTRAVVFGLALIAVALLGVGVGAVRYQLGAAWSPLTAATYVVVGVRIFLRIQGPTSEKAH